MYCAIIGDIVKSRDIRDRRDVQLKLEEVLRKINKEYKEVISAKFTITLGDEFQGLINGPDMLFEIIDNIKFKLNPVSFRFGIGIGEMATDIKEVALGSDGPAYHVAREALNEVKKSNTKYSQPERDMLIYTASTDKYKIDELEMLNAILSTCYFIESKWSDKQLEIIHHLINNNETQRELANLYGVSQPSITRRIENSGYYTYKFAKENAKKYIVNFWEKING